MKKILKNKQEILNISFKITGCIIPFILIIIIILFFRIPDKQRQSIIDLKGNWKIQEGNNPEWIKYDHNTDLWKDIIIPGNFYNQGYHGKHSVIKKEFKLTGFMENKELFFIIGGTLGSMGSVYINGHKIGEIGITVNNKKTQGTDSKYGLSIDKDFIFKESKNVIAVEFTHETIGYNGIQDPRIYIGVSDFLKPYYNKNIFITSFYQYGQIYTSAFLLLIIILLLAVEWEIKDKYKYISTVFLVFSVFFYNLCFSGAFLLYMLDFLIMAKLLKVSIAFICLALGEFLLFYFLNRINIAGKVNRIICSSVMMLFLIFNNFIIIQKIYLFFIIYFFIFVIYLSILSFYYTLAKKNKKYAVIISTSVILAAVTGIIDFLTVAGIMYLPLLFNMSISIFIIMSATVIITEFLGLSYTNKMLNNNLLTLNMNLEKKVADRTKKLTLLNTKLKRLNDIKNEFIANITHNFKSPISAILSISDLGMIYKNNKNTDDFEIINRAAVKLKNSVDKLLDLAKIDLKGIRINITKIDLLQLISKITDYYLSINKNRVKIIKNFSDKLNITIHSDQDKLEEIFNNIISNSLKFSDIGSCIIKISILEKKNSILIIINDNGIGIPKDKLKLIFKRFEQINDKESRNYRGTGIGLAYSRQLLKYLKGTIRAESEGINKGASFFIEIKKI